MKMIFSNLSTEKKLAGVGLLLGLIAIFAGNPYGGATVEVNEKDIALSTVGNADKISNMELADWIIKDKSDFELVDLRSEEKFNEYSIPGAQSIPITQLPESDLLRNQKIIFYSDNETRATQAWFLLKAKKYKAVYILAGGLNSWKGNILYPKAPLNPTKEQSVQFEKMKEVAKYFGGQAQTDSTVAEKKVEIKLPTTNTITNKTTAPIGEKKKREGC